MAIVGRALTFHKKAQFQVLIDGFTSAAFSKMSALECEIAEIKYYEGGTLIPNKSLGRMEFKDLTLERGACSDVDAYAWFSMGAVAPANVGLKDSAYKRHMEVIQADRDGEVVRRWTIFNAFVKGFTAGEWDNNADEVVIEKMVIAYDWFQRTL